MLSVSSLNMVSAESAKFIGAHTILEKDPTGVTVAIISIGVVITVLALLAIIIAIFSRIVVALSAQTAQEAAPESTSGASVDAGANGEVVAAIALALKLYQEDVHDHESEIITINTVARSYSPWSSKIHGLTNLPR